MDHIARKNPTSTKSGGKIKTVSKKQEKGGKKLLDHREKAWDAAVDKTRSR